MSQEVAVSLPSELSQITEARSQLSRKTLRSYLHLSTPGVTYAAIGFCSLSNAGAVSTSRLEPNPFTHHGRAPDLLEVHQVVQQVKEFVAAKAVGQARRHH